MGQRLPVIAAGFLLAAVACGQEEAGQSADRPPIAARDGAAAAPAPVGDPPSSHPLVPAITDGRLLATLEADGLRLAALLGGGQAKNNAELHAASPRYRDFAAATAEDIAASVADENRYRPDWGQVGPTLHAKRRNLDPGWLTAANVSYELVGVINRMDRAPFAPATCGELRLIYRLAYRAPKIASRLPLTVNVVYLLEPGTRSCRQRVAEWRLPPGAGAAWLRSQGPLRPDNLQRLKSVETNYQVIRSAAGIRNQMGGSAEYVLRVFHPQGDHLVRAPLEN